MTFAGPNGANFSGSLETENVKSPPFKHLKLESLTRSLYVNAPNGIVLNSKAGPLRMTSLDNVKIKSLKGKVPKIKLSIIQSEKARTCVAFISGFLIPQLEVHVHITQMQLAVGGLEITPKSF